MNEGTTVLRNTQSSRHRHRLCRRPRLTVVVIKFEPRGQDGFDVTIFFHPLLIVLAQLPRHPRIPKLNMSVSSAYFPIIFFSLVPSLLFNALLLAYPYHLLVRGEQRDLILGLSITPCTLLLPPVPPAAIPTLPSFLFPLSLSLPDHATHRACCFVYPLRTSIHGEEWKELFSARFDKRLRR